MTKPDTNISTQEKDLLMAARAYQRLCVVYRLGKQPTEVLFKLLAKADKIIDSYGDIES